MTPAVEQLVRDAMELTGAPQPALLEDDAPILSRAALAPDETSFYLVGLIGGKEVGKSALVNALAGRDITAITAFGPGTEGVVAYAHGEQARALRALLDREVPGQYRIITHELPALRRQVLLDLPDIDSHFASHLNVTRAMLRHMLFPVWLVSVEKYADRQPQQMLAKVAAGNAPRNFVFVLNKVDQMEGVERSGLGATRSVDRPSLSMGTEPALASGPAEEVRDDYAARVGRTLGLDAPPHVYLISALHPDRYELPALRAALARERAADAVRQSQDLAARTQDRSLLAWLDGQQIPARAQRLARLQEDAQELAAQRIGGPLLDEVVPRLLDDPAARGTMAEEILTERVARWPLVRLVHTLLSPLFVLLRGATSRTAAPLQPPEGLVEIVLRETGHSVSTLVQTTFAQLRQSEPAIAELYAHNRLWEPMSADLAAAELRRGLGSTIQRQRDVARECLVRGAGRAGAPLRWLVTVGALLWFPFVQPVLYALLGGYDASRWQSAARLAVQVLGVDYLLKSAGFLILYYIALWLALRWNTQRKVVRLLRGWRATDLRDPSLNLASQVLAWIEGLVEPIRQARTRMESLTQRARQLQESLQEAA